MWQRAHPPGEPSRALDVLTLGTADALLRYASVFALPGICLLLIFLLARPQELFPELQKVPFLHIAAALAVFGYIVDIRLHRLQPIAANTLPWVLGFFAWTLVSVAGNLPEMLPRMVLEMSIIFVLYGTLAHGIQRLRTFQFVAGVLAVVCVFIGAVCFHQGFAPKQCVGGQDRDGEILGRPDGRHCELHEQCYGPDAEPGLEYRCEKVGLFGTYSVDNRVRYRGDLHDPNEVALALATAGIGLLIGFALRKRRASAQLMMGLGVALLLATILFTRSRGGLIAALLVPGVYVIRRYGWSAIIPLILLALPMFVLNIRGGADAQLSTLNRYEAWAAGLRMFEDSPVYGIGPRMFTDHFWLTAHNSYVLTLAELGIVGMFLFVAILYLCMKTLIVGLRALRTIPGTAAAQVWGMALMSALAGIAFQINTLSFAYHSVLWLFVGLCGAWQSAVRHHRPELVVRLTLRDIAIVAGLVIGYAFVALPLLLKYKGVL